MRLTWDCPQPECDDKVVVENFDGYTMSTFRNIAILHAESHSIPATFVTQWMAEGLTWAECSCTLGFWASFENTILAIRKHVELTYHGQCPYCHQRGLPAPAIFRALSATPTCPCGRFLPQGFRIDTGAGK